MKRLSNFVLFTALFCICVVFVGCNTTRTSRTFTWHPIPQRVLEEANASVNKEHRLAQPKAKSAKIDMSSKNSSWYVSGGDEDGGSSITTFYDEPPSPTWSWDAKDDTQEIRIPMVGVLSMRNKGNGTIQENDYILNRDGGIVATSGKLDKTLSTRITDGVIGAGSMAIGAFPAALILRNGMMHQKDRINVQGGDGGSAFADANVN